MRRLQQQTRFDSFALFPHENFWHVAAELPSKFLWMHGWSGVNKAHGPTIGASPSTKSQGSSVKALRAATEAPQNVKDALICQPRASAITLWRNNNREAITTIMVLLTITPSIAEALKKRTEATGDSAKEELQDGEPNLENPSVGDPISHDQIIDIWKDLRSRGHRNCRLETLLRGAKVYVPPPPPKAEPVGTCYLSRVLWAAC